MTGDGLSIQVIHSELFFADTKWNHPMNLYPYNTLYFVLGGDGYVKVGDTVTPLRAGHVYLISANTLFSCWCDTFIHKFYVEAYVEALPGEDVFSALTGLLERPYPPADTQSLIGHDTASLKDQAWLQGALLCAFSLFIDAAWQPPGKEQQRFRPILEDIARSLGSDIRLTDIARTYGWHPSALSRAFHRAFGCGLKHYASQLLLNKLKQELIITNRPLRELAAQYRFCDAYYLSAFFKKHAGISPDQYRKLSGRYRHPR